MSDDIYTLHDAAANALRTAWLNGKANTTQGWALHVEADTLVEYIREQVAREIEAARGPAHKMTTESQDGFAVRRVRDDALARAARIARGEV